MQEIEACIADLKTLEDEIEARELARIIEKFLDTLTLENRVIFMRRYWFADSYKDIAEFVGLTEKIYSIRLTPYPGENETIPDRKGGIHMNCKKFSDAMSKVDDKYVDEAISYKAPKKE